MFGSKNMAFLQFPQHVPHNSQHTFLCFLYIFAIFQFLDDDYGIPPTAEMIHLLVPTLPLITMSTTSRFSMIPHKFLQTRSSVKCTLPPSRAGMACCEDSKANVNDVNDARSCCHDYLLFHCHSPMPLMTRDVPVITTQLSVITY